MNAWANALLLVNIFHGVVALGRGVSEPINSCKAQSGGRYETEWSLDFSNGKPECVQDCLDNLMDIQSGDAYWEGCFHRTSCDNYCACTLDSYSIVNGFATFKDAVGNLRRPTEVFKSWFAERYEGTMYVSYDCRRSSPFGSRYRRRRPITSRSRFPYWYR